MVAIDQQKIIDFIKLHGPILPVQLAKFMGSDIIIASAHLSDLVSSKKVLISNTKVGGSPVYYVEGQESKLQELAKHLNEKDQKAFALLKDRKVLRDSELNPLMRVAMRTIKDFAVPLQVSSVNGTEIFWKWYLISDDTAKSEIKKILEIQEKQQTLQQMSALQAAPEPIRTQTLEVQKTTAEISKPIEKKVEDTKKEVERLQEIRSEALDTIKTEKLGAVVEKKPEVKIEVKRKTEIEPIKELKKEKLTEKQAKIEERIHKTEEKQKKVEEQKVEAIEEKTIVEKKVKKAVDDLFLNKVTEYFASKGVIIAEHSIVKKNSEIDLIVKIPSAVGMIEHFCKAKNKKRINEGDLSSAFVQGQLKKMPAILLANGELVKKAREQLERDLKGIIFLKL